VLRNGAVVTTIIVVAATLGAVAAGIGGAERSQASTSRCQSGPKLKVIPSRGPVGTHFRLVGSCFPRERGLTEPYGVFLLHDFRRPKDCELIAGDPHYRFTIERNGNARGHYIVPSHGACFQHTYGRRVTPAVYRIGVGCHACLLTQFRVTRR
jgi:hypothetical protein